MSKHLHPIQISSGSLEALKWLAMISMTIDHTNRVFFDGSLDWAYCVGRIAMPLFAFVFSYNYAQNKGFSPDFYNKSFRRLLCFGILATPAYMAMKSMHELIPLNIMFLFMVIAACLYFYEERGAWSVESLAVALAGGIFVEYGWPGVLLGIAYWVFCKRLTLVTTLMAVAATALLYVVNANNWAMLALPIIVMAACVTVPIPRCRYLFWVFYPLHMTLLVLLRWVMWG